MATIRNEVPNVLSEYDIPKRLSEGWRIVVVTLEDAEKRQSYWYGQWGIKAVSSDGRYEQTLVTHRKGMEARVFKSINGLVSFLDQYGVTMHVIPTKQSQVAWQTVDEK
ncbi:hypothetical protein [Paracoccus albus]|uniref:hypothetical protein n=1 Tax=Paracoccus albus TaxID=3017784 RepID=UPI0022F0A6B6|nr:hypothetical protein [Paracoccus albus]WBU62221.1 hypothetical protein PAF20_18090 [Paracoccus albus]